MKNLLFLVVLVIIGAIIAEAHVVYSNDRVQRSAETIDPIIVGANECTYGPSFWCASKKNADKCNAVPFCVEKHWENGSPPQ